MLFATRCKMWFFHHCPFTFCNSSRKVLFKFFFEHFFRIFLSKGFVSKFLFKFIFAIFYLEISRYVAMHSCMFFFHLCVLVLIFNRVVIFILSLTASVENKVRENNGEKRKVNVLSSCLFVRWCQQVCGDRSQFDCCHHLFLGKARTIFSLRSIF